MEIHKTNAVILKREKYSESSLVITFLTPDRGRLSCVAKGCRRVKSPFGDGLSLFALSEIVYYFRPYRGLQIVAESDLEWFPWTIRNSPLRFLYASIFSDLLLSAVSGQAPDPSLFDLVLSGLRVVDRSETAGLPAVLWSMELKLLSILGYRPILDGCSVCQTGVQSGQLYLDPARGGLVCEKHGQSGQGAKRLSIGSARLLGRLLRLPVDKSSRLRAGPEMRAEIDTAMSSFIIYHLGVGPNRYLVEIAGKLGGGGSGGGGAENRRRS